MAIWSQLSALSPGLAVPRQKVQLIKQCLLAARGAIASHEYKLYRLS